MPSSYDSDLNNELDDLPKDLPDLATPIGAKPSEGLTAVVATPTLRAGSMTHELDFALFSPYDSQSFMPDLPQTPMPTPNETSADSTPALTPSNSTPSAPSQQQISNTDRASGEITARRGKKRKETNLNEGNEPKRQNTSSTQQVGGHWSAPLNYSLATAEQSIINPNINTATNNTHLHLLASFAVNNAAVNLPNTSHSSSNLASQQRVNESQPTLTTLAQDQAGIDGRSLNELLKKAVSQLQSNRMLAAAQQELKQAKQELAQIKGELAQVNQELIQLTWDTVKAAAIQENQGICLSNMERSRMQGSQQTNTCTSLTTNPTTATESFYTAQNPNLLFLSPTAGNTTSTQQQLAYGLPTTD